MTKKKLLIWIPAVALLLNGIGYLIVTRGGVSKKAEPASGGGRTASGESSAREGGPTDEREGAAREPDRSAASATGRGPQGDTAKNDEDRALARRAAGLAALEAGDYDKALIQFTEARALLGDRAHVGELLRVTEDLRSRSNAPARPRGGEVAPAPLGGSRPAGRATTARRLAVREEAVAPPPSPASPPESPTAPSGLLIVTTTPRGLLVQIDDNPVDLTPMRTRIRPGSHRVALLDGDRRVYETTVDVKEGGTATLLKDLGTEPGAPEAPRPTTVPPLPPAPAGREEVAARPPVSAAAEDVARSQPAGLVPARPDAVRVPEQPLAATGTLSISSPGIYGVVWINGRARGYPPLQVRDLPAGPTRVEVRVNGVQKRASTVTVNPGSTTIVKLSSEDAVP